MRTLLTKLKRKFGIPYNIRKMAHDNKATVETIVCKFDDVPENGMKEFPSGPNNEKILLVKQNGKIFAVGNTCTHYGAPLIKGALGDGRVRCPWHGACFNLKTGDIEDFPGLDSLPRFNVTVDKEGLVRLKGVRGDFVSKKRQKKMEPRNSKNHHIIAVIGAGVAASTFVETLRQEGYTGGIVVIGKEKYLPYDRVKCNKRLDSEYDKIVLRSQEFYDKHNINFKLGEEVQAIDIKKKSIKTANGLFFQFDKLFIACGVKARCLPNTISGWNLQNIFTLRGLDDSTAIFDALTENSNVVIYGSSFIGMETAAYCAGKVKSVTVVGRSKFPYIESLGELIGKRILELFQTNGVVMKMENGIKEYQGDSDGNVTHVLLNDGSVIPADVCVMGIGTEYDTDFLKDSGIERNKRGSIEVDEYLATNLPFVYAGGDVACAPVFSSGNIKASIGHFQLAQYHGHMAAINILGKSKPIKAVPFFWSTFFGKGLRYTGYTTEYSDVIIKGSLENLKFSAFYCKGDKVVALATMDSDPLAAKFAELLYDGHSLNASELSNEYWTIKS